MENQFFVDSEFLSPEALKRKHELETNPASRKNHMEYMPGMEIIKSDIRETVMAHVEEYDYDKYTARDVRAALDHETCSVEDFKALLSPAAAPFLEEMAQKARIETGKHFGNTVYLFTPLYIANYCENYCVYCGFNCYNHINRMKLNMEQIEKEMQVIADSGMEEILILTGESRAMSDVKYIGEACKLARKYFRMVGVEIYPVNTDEYRYLHECGVDYVTVFQETYDNVKYETLHLRDISVFGPTALMHRKSPARWHERGSVLCTARSVRFQKGRTGKRTACLLFAAEISSCRNVLILSQTAPDYQ